MSKLHKLRRSPHLFFRDAKSPLVRGGARLLSPWLERPELHRLLLDPVDALAGSGLPPVASLARRVGERRSVRRHALIAAHGEPRVSVVMAAKDAAESLEAAAGSILEQSYRNLELIVVDDGSSDATGALADALALRDPRVRALHLQASRGAAYARNLGMTEASGEMLTFQDSDDVSHPERVERQLSELLAHPEAVLCQCSYRRVDAEGRTLIVNGRAYRKCVIAMMFRRAPVIERVGYLQDLRVGEDAEYLGRILAAFGPGRRRELLAPLYDARYAAGSLLFGDGSAREQARGRLEHHPSPETEASEREWREEHRLIAAGLSSPRTPFTP